MQRLSSLASAVATGGSSQTNTLSPGSTVASALTPVVTTAASSEVDQKIQHANSRIDMLQNHHQHMLNDVTRLLKTIENSKLENRILKDNLKEIRQIAQDLHKTLALNQVSILALEERLINLEKISYDGTLLWRITNVSERIQEAKSGRQTSFYSPPFYTSRNGYKMCVRVYLNGDGNGRNTHLSLFFVILRGEFDALLRWPFRQKVTFILIDQTASESKENVYDAFRPDPNSSSFKRPTSDMNIASGLPVFCPLSKLTASSDHEYVKDNTMFIKTIVDISDLPTV
jgi:TNF receptor-associated factor 2